MIKVNTVGQIVSGSDKGLYVYIKKEKTGWYRLIYSKYNNFNREMKDSEKKQGGNYLLEDIETIEAQIDYNEWQIQWLD